MPESRSGAGLLKQEIRIEEQKDAATAAAKKAEADAATVVPDDPTAVPHDTTAPGQTVSR